MARRFSDINRGPLLQQAYQRRLAYLSRDIAERNASANLGTRTGSPAVFGAVSPFGDDVPSGGYIVRTNQRNRSRLGDEVNSEGIRFTTPAPAGAVQNSSFQPAKIRLFVQTSTRVDTSRYTGMRYLRRVGESFSHPFGASASTEREFEAFTAIATALRTNPAHKVSYSPEKLRGN